MTSRPSDPFVAYFRVSTDRQGARGLGMDAQRSAVARHLAGHPGALLAEFVEVESGRRTDRPELLAALTLCRQKKAMLVIAKLDRLARNVHFISGLMESGARCTGSSASRPTRACSTWRTRIERWNQSRMGSTGAFAAERTSAGRAGSPSLIAVTGLPSCQC